MSREWKPGDVAMRRKRRGADQVSLLVSTCVAPEHVRGPHWHHTSGGWDRLDWPHATSVYHPLAVIDAENAEQVERLAKLLWPHYSDVESARLCKTEITADALREFADPTPRIEEPLERWSRVFDGEGREWCRTEWDGGLDKPWQHDGTHAHWSALSKHHGPVTLSPGVPS